MSKKIKCNENFSDPDLLPEYDFDAVPILGKGPAFIRSQVQQSRKKQATTNASLTVEIAHDVQPFFPTAQAVNEALRTLIHLTSGKIPNQSVRG